MSKYKLSEDQPRNPAESDSGVHLREKGGFFAQAGDGVPETASS